MNLRDNLKNYFLEKSESRYEISEIRFLDDGGIVFYIKMNDRKGTPCLRCKMDREGKVHNFYPMMRFNENSHSPWDTTIKDAKNIFSAFPGIGGVANRTVNRSLI